MSGFDSPSPSFLSPGSDPFTGSINLVSETPGVPGDDDRELILIRIGPTFLDLGQLDAYLVVGGA